MSTAPRRHQVQATSRADRLQPWIAAVATALLHALLVLLGVLAPPVTLSNPEGSAGGGRIEVTYIETTASIPSPPEFPRTPEPARKPAPPRPEAVQPAATRVASTPVAITDAPVPPDADLPRDAASPPTGPPPAIPPAHRPRQHARGQPPGMLPEQHARMNAGRAPTPVTYQGPRYRASAAEANMEAGGFQVIYDLVSETRLREWRDEGMTELSLPLPGVRQLMVCPLETALKRESGPCRLVEPDDPDLAAIGDARKAITMERVYRRGELVWRGPGPYR